MKKSCFNLDEHIIFYWFSNQTLIINYVISQNYRSTVFYSQRTFYDKEWQKYWIRYKQILSRMFFVTQQQDISKKRLKAHSLLTKVESFLIIQIRIEKIDLTDFLHRRRVSDAINSTCACDWLKQTARHVIMNCNLYNNREKVLENSIHDYQSLISDFKKLKEMIAWLMNTSLLSQFNLIMLQSQK